MELEELHVLNLRRIKSDSFKFYKFTTLIGPNNTGKSTVLRALQILLNQEKPSEEEWYLENINNPIEITGTFANISDDERNKPGIASLVFNNKIKLKVRATIVDSKVELSYLAYAREENISGWSDSWGSLSDNLKQFAQNIGIQGQAWRVKANKERFRQYLRDNQPNLIELGEAGWTDEGISIKPALQQGLPRVEIVPAVRDAQDESQLTQRKNILKEILESEILPEIRQTNQYAEIVSQAQELSSRMSSADGKGLTQTNQISEELSAGAKSVLNLDVLFRLEPPDVTAFIGKGARIKLSDGNETSVYLQGHGAQRALVYSLVRYIANRRATSKEFVRSKILLFEEPELYLHPHLLRTLRDSLRELSGLNDWQVITTTHSPIMVDVASEPRSLIIMNRTQNGEVIYHKQLDNDPFTDNGTSPSERKILRAMLDFHPTVCEAFFAKSTVLVEGDSEVAMLNFGEQVLSKLGLPTALVSDTSVVSCGGKWTIVPIARLLIAFGIPCKIIHDEDRKGLSDKELEAKPAIHPFKANVQIEEIVSKNRVFLVSDTLEEILFLEEETRKLKDKPFRAWVQIQEIIENDEILKHERLCELFKFAFTDE